MTALFDVTPTPAATTAARSRPLPLVIGLDIALTNSGVAGPDWTDHIRTGTLRGEPRLDTILERAASFYRHADLAIIEGPSYGSAMQGGHDELAAARWIIRHDLWRRGIPTAVVPPASRTIYAVGTARPKHPATGPAAPSPTTAHPPASAPALTPSDRLASVATTPTDASPPTTRPAARRAPPAPRGHPGPHPPPGAARGPTPPSSLSPLDRSKQHDRQYHPL